MAAQQLRLPPQQQGRSVVAAWLGTLLLLLLQAASAAPAPALAPVTVDIFIMSKCPDAEYCIEALQPVLAALQPAGVSNATLHYIRSRYWPQGPLCLHGEQECAGNLQQLCVQQHSSPKQPAQWMAAVYPFVLCNMRAGWEASGTLATASRCLRQSTAIPRAQQDSMLACIKDERSGRALLAAELDNTHSRHGVQTSCTIRVEGATLCVRDMGMWTASSCSVEQRNHTCKAACSAAQLTASICTAHAAKNGGRTLPPCAPAAAPAAAPAIAAEAAAVKKAPVPAAAAAAAAASATALNAQRQQAG